MKWFPQGFGTRTTLAVIFGISINALALTVALTAPEMLEKVWGGLLVLNTIIIRDLFNARQEADKRNGHNQEVQ